MQIVLLFDYDDTLVQTRQCKFAAIKALGKQLYRVSLSNEDIETHWGKPYLQFFGDLFNADGMELDRLLQEYERYNDAFPMRPHEDAARMIAALSRRYDCGIVSSASTRRIKAQLGAMSVDWSRFSYLQGAEATLEHKPDPAVFRPAITTMRERHGEQVEITYVGDSYADYCAAHGAGLRFIGIARCETDQRLMEAAGAQVINSLDELNRSV
jgi:phosphoglycolate phosphatase-like HAD superfamily hydrolase